MIKHIFLVAIRNLLKYRQQTLISIIGLAIGFVCFALSAYWIRYEMSFDAFHKNADKIYQVQQIDNQYEKVINPSTAQALAPTIEKYFPETKACHISRSWLNLNSEQGQYNVEACIFTGKRFLEIFDISMLHGTFNDNDPSSAVITDQLAKKLFNTDNPVGKELICYSDGVITKKYIISGCIKAWPQNTNISFEILIPNDPNNNSNWSTFGIFGNQVTYISIDPKLPVKPFLDKFRKWSLKEILNAPSFTLVPIKKVYYTEPIIRNNSRLKIEQIVLFAILGLLVIVCALFNYLNLYASRMRIRIKELSLRKVNGATKYNLFALLGTEFLIIIFVSCLIGLLAIECSLSVFKRFSCIRSDQIQIYAELGIYTILLTGISLLMVCAVIYYISRKQFQDSIRVTNRKHSALFNRMGILLQMIISSGFIFYTTVYFKQIHTLGNTDTGYTRENMLYFKAKHIWDHRPDRSEQIQLSQVNREIEDEIKKTACVTDMIPVNESSVICPRRSMSGGLMFTEEMGKEQAVEYEAFLCSPGYIRFYELQLVSGIDFKPEPDNNNWNVILNETAAKALGLKDPVGKTVLQMEKPFYDTDGSIIQYPETDQYTIIGVVKDFIFESPLDKVRPIMMRYGGVMTSETFCIKYPPGQYTETKETLTNLINKKFETRQVSVFRVEDSYREQYKAESSLILYLALLSGVCIVISLFGIYSLVALNTEYRRKEIAVRKVNGATLISIFHLLTKEYMLMLCFACVIAYPIGYVIIKPWIERFIVQTPISWWLYPLLFLLTALIILLTIAGRVRHTASINPATELKKE